MTNEQTTGETTANEKLQTFIPKIETKPKAMFNLKPKDIIALVVIFFVLLGKLKGFNGSLDAVLTMILGYYFVKRVDGIDKGK